jgi:proline racemase
VLTTVDYHTAGEPFRIVTAGATVPEGRTVLDRREAAQAGDLDRVRALLCNEPRGHADMYGGFLVPPDDDGAHAGVLFWHKDGFSTACGHGTIALATYLVDEGLVAAPVDGEADVVIDVPSGRVVAAVAREGGRVDRRALPSTSVVRRSPAISRSSDVARPGACRPLLRRGDLRERRRRERSGCASTRPTSPTSSRSGARSSGRSTRARRPGTRATRGSPASTARSGTRTHDRWRAARTSATCTVFADGEVDRSPCGSGTSARLALLHDSGAVTADRPLVHDSIVGTTFVGRVLGTGTSGGVPTVATEIQGAAYRTGEHRFVLDPHDPVGEGFQLR